MSIQSMIVSACTVSVKSAVHMLGLSFLAIAERVVCVWGLRGGGGGGG